MAASIPRAGDDYVQARTLLETLAYGPVLLADTVSDTDDIRTGSEGPGAFANIPAKRRGTRSFAFGPFLYRDCN